MVSTAIKNEASDCIPEHDQSISSGIRMSHAVWNNEHLARSERTSASTIVFSLGSDLRFVHYCALRLALPFQVRIHCCECTKVNDY
jgi:hypothetical protein